MKKLKMIWNCNQVSGMNGKITVNGFSPVLGDKINKTIAKMHHVGEMKIQAEEGTEGYDFFKDGKIIS